MAENENQAVNICAVDYISIVIFYTALITWIYQDS